jgi:hypothetical protein
VLNILKCKFRYKKKRNFYNFNRAEIQNDRPETYLKALEQYCLSQQYNLVLCVLSNNRKDRYDALKKFLCMDTAVPSQVRNFIEIKYFSEIIIFFYLDGTFKNIK